MSVKMTLLKDVQHILDIKDTVRFAKLADRKLRELSGRMAKYQYNRAALFSRMANERGYEVIGFESMSDFIDSFSKIDGISRNSVYRWIRAYDCKVTRPLIGQMGVSKLDHMVRAHSALQEEAGMSEEEATGRVARMAIEVQKASESVLKTIAPEEVSERKGKPLTTGLTKTLADEMIQFAKQEGKTTLQKVKDELAQVIQERKRIHNQIKRLKEKDAELARKEEALKAKTG